MDQAQTMVARWAPQVALSILDQGLFSGANFLLNVLLARWLPLPEYGAFALAFSVYLFVAGFHSALILEPMAVIGVKHTGSRFRTYIRDLLGIHVLLTASLSAFVAVALLVVNDRLLRSALLGVVITLPFVLLFWLARRINYLEVRAERAAFGSGTYSGVLLVLIAFVWKLGWLTATTAFFALGIASVVASVFSLGRLSLGLRMSIHDKMSQSMRGTVAEHMQYGKWAVVTSILSLFTTQSQMFLIAAIIGLEGVGTMRALLNFILPMGQVVTAIGIFGLPVVAAAYHAGCLDTLRRRTMVVTSGLTGVALLYEIALLLLARPIERLVYGGQFANHAGLIPILGLITVFTALASGFGLELRAMQRPDLVLIATALAVPVSIGSSIGLTYLWGLTGGVASLSLAYGVIAVVTCWLCRRVRVGSTGVGMRAVRTEESKRQPLQSVGIGFAPRDPWRSTVSDETPQVRP